MRVLLFFILACIAGNCAAEASGYFTSTDGIRLHYIDAGEGETLLFVPGWQMPAEIWRRQIDYFSRRYHVVALDPRSQGESELAPSANGIRRRAEDLHDLIEHLQANRVVLIGWSLGVMEALLYVNTHGDGKVAALVLVDNSVGENPPQQGGKTYPGRRPEDRHLEVADFVRVIFNSPQPPEYLAWLTAQVLRTPPQAAASLFPLPYPRTFWRAAVHKTRKPLLFAVTAGLQGQAETLRRKRLGTSIELFPDAGHALFVDEDVRFNAVLDAFLDRTLNDGPINE